ncbi:MAG: CDGSH-type Zn-finger protein [Kiritimatiellia bacterium]|jgi:CDGSH-type Zn-finger protein
MSPPVTVTVLPNGPLKIQNAQGVNFCGDRLDVSGDIYLCRCGNSSNAPFCDGSHKRTGFSGAHEDSSNAEMRVWEGQTIRTHFNRKACMHAFYCKPLKELRAAEIAGDANAANEIMRVVDLCPSGALSYEIKTDLQEPDPRHFDVGIDIIEGGEVRLQGGFLINEPLQQRQASTRATLCRCGESKNKPWCDGRHKRRKGFR